MDLPAALLLFNLGTGEIVVIVLLIVLLFGAHRIPDLARALGKAQREFQRARDDVERESTSLTVSEDERIKKAAMDLGIPTEGKTVEELKAAIAAKLGQAPTMRPA